MLILDPNDPKKLALSLSKAVRQSGLSQSEIIERLKQDYGVEIKQSGLSHVIRRCTIRLQRALQILAICGASEVEIKGVTVAIH